MIKQKLQIKTAGCIKTKPPSRPIPFKHSVEANGSSSKAHIPEKNIMDCSNIDIQTVTEKPENNFVEKQEAEEENKDLYKSEVERFVEVSKYFSNPLKTTASYICENCLVSFPNPYLIKYKRGGVTTQNLKFTNLTLEPVYVKLYKLIPDLEQIKYINLSLSRCKRIPPGLSFTLGFVYDDVNERPSCNAKMVFVASRKTTTPCYQICEINLRMEAQKTKIIQV